MTQVLLSIGSNQNDPKTQILLAFDQIRQAFEHAEMSRLYLTEPVGGITQDAFINGAIRFDTELSPVELLAYLMELERMAGRNRDQETPNGPRNLDLDIILFGTQIVSLPDLKLPHPRYKERRFVLKPMLDIAADVIDPLIGKSVRQLLDECQDASWVKLLNEEIVAV